MVWRQCTAGERIVTPPYKIRNTRRKTGLCDHICHPDTTAMRTFALSLLILYVGTAALAVGL